LTQTGYSYTFIDALSPAVLTNFPFEVADSKVNKEARRSRVLMSCTVSHLQAIYTAFTRRNSVPRTYISSYVVVVEDDVRFLYDIGWPELIRSAPKGIIDGHRLVHRSILAVRFFATVSSRYRFIKCESSHFHVSLFYHVIDWSILQLVTCNDRAVESLYSNLWLETKSLWEIRNRDVYWSTGAYVVNLEKLGPLFGNATEAEKGDVNVRFDMRKLFARRCDRKDTSMAARLR
jgi:hypothetical protein